MKHKNHQQEILLMATPGFTAIHLLYKAPDQPNPGQLSIMEQLEEACWSGLLHELIPEIILRSASGKNLYTWQIHYSITSLQILLCEFPSAVDPALSIDPQHYMATISYN